MIVGMVENTPGVTSLSDRLKVAGFPPGTAQSDTPLGIRVRQSIMNQPAVAAAAPNVSINEQNGTVTLTGVASSESEKMQIENAVKNTPGVVMVYDYMTIG